MSLPPRNDGFLIVYCKRIFSKYFSNKSTVSLQLVITPILKKTTLVTQSILKIFLQMLKLRFPLPTVNRCVNDNDEKML